MSTQVVWPRGRVIKQSKSFNMASPKPINSGVAAGKAALAGRCHNPQINRASRSARRLHLEQSCYINSTMNKLFPQGPKQPPAHSQNNTVSLASLDIHNTRIPRSLNNHRTVDNRPSSFVFLTFMGSVCGMFSAFSLFFAYQPPSVPLSRGLTRGVGSFSNSPP